MTISSTALIEDLIEKTRRNLNEGEKLKELPLDILNKRSSADRWSALECLEHLNLYGDFYLPEIEKKMAASTIESASTFKAGLLGNYFAKSMTPKEQLNTMKTFKDKNPINSKLDKKCVDRFINQQRKMLDLLTIARDKNLNKIKTGISISKLIKLKLGDTFRVVIYHNERHIQQALNEVNA